MTIPVLPRRSRGTPPRANAATIAIWVFVVVEATGIAYVLWTY